MSQQKVEKKKELKKNRKEIVKRNKVRSALATCGGILVLALIVFYIAFSGYQRYSAYKKENPESLTINTSAISDYETGLSEDEDASSDDSEDETADESGEEDSKDTEEDAAEETPEDDTEE